ncbi:MAG: hypothetical protein Aurels2KO_55560 [Aureliella sp.]
MKLQTNQCESDASHRCGASVDSAKVWKQCYWEQLVPGPVNDRVPYGPHIDEPENTDANHNQDPNPKPELTEAEDQEAENKSE